MSTLVGLKESRDKWEAPPAKPLDEVVWQAWVAKGRAQDLRSNAAHANAVKWASIAGLLAAAGLWSRLAPYEIVVRFMVVAGAIVALVQAFQARHYVFAAVFGALALLFSPLVPLLSFAGDWQRSLVALAALPFLGSLTWYKIRPAAKSELGVTVSGSALAPLLMFGVLSAGASAGDLSKYRDFQFGTDLLTVAKQAGIDPTQAKVVHLRPALIQELAWRPQPLDWASRTEPAQVVVFSFYNGELFQIAVNYDRYETEGLTNGDIIEVISATYGIATRPSAPAKAVLGSYGDPDEVVARWQDAQNQFDLIRSSYGPTYRLIGVLKRLETPVQAAILEASRLDDQEAPQREATRIATEEGAARAKLEKARSTNKPKFRP